MENGTDLRKFLHRIQKAYRQDEQSRKTIRQIERRLSKKETALALLESEKFMECLMKKP